MKILTFLDLWIAITFTRASLLYLVANTDAILAYTVFYLALISMGFAYKKTLLRYGFTEYLMNIQAAMSTCLVAIVAFASPPTFYGSIKIIRLCNQYLVVSST